MENGTNLAWSFFLKKGIGVYVGPKEVVAASIFLSKGVPNLDRFAIEPIIEAEASQKEQIKPGKKELTLESRAIRRALNKIGAGKSSQVVTAFNPFHLVTRYFEIPLIPRKEWDSAVRYEASRYIPFKISETVVDFKILEEPKTKMLRVTSAAVKVEILRHYMNHLRSASAKIEAIEPVFLALSRAVQATEKIDSNKTYGYLFLDDDGSVNITLSRAGVTYLSRDFLLSEDQKANETRFYEELKVSMDFAQQKTGTSEIEKVFIAGSGDLNFWSDFLTSVFGKTIQFQPALFPVKQVIPSNLLSKLIIPIGLGLRSFNLKSSLGAFSLVPPAEKESQRKKIRYLVGYEFLAAALFFAILRFAILGPYAFLVQKQVIKAMGPVAESAPDKISLSIDELQGQKGEITKQVQVLNSFLKQRSSFPGKLRIIARSMPSSMWLRQLTYGSKSETGFESQSGTDKLTAPKSLILEGQCYIGNPEAEVKVINDWARQLDESKAFKEGFKKVAVAEVRRDNYMARNVTSFKVVIE